MRHGWALTAHQAVGLRLPAAVVVLPGDAAQSLTRPWIYTAFGRAERHLSVVHGVDQALARAVAEVPQKPRTTRLPALLTAQVPARRGTGTRGEREPRCAPRCAVTGLPVTATAVRTQLSDPRRAAPDRPSSRAEVVLEVLVVRARRRRRR